jgi:hypothetical protein
MDEVFVTVTVLAAPVVEEPAALLPQPSGPLATIETYVDKEQFVVQAMDAAPMVPAAVVSETVERPSLSPTRGMGVAFRSATETMRDQAIPALVLGLVLAVLLIAGLGRRTDEEDEG